MLVKVIILQYQQIILNLELVSIRLINQNKNRRKGKILKYFCHCI